MDFGEPAMLTALEQLPRGARGRILRGCSMRALRSPRQYIAACLRSANEREVQRAAGQQSSG
eukprot:10949427-Alexandrium_andersonii.AAC.1